MTTAGTTTAARGVVSTFVLLLLLPVAIAYPALVVIVGLAVGAVCAGRWFARALREADDRYQEFANTNGRSRLG